VAVDVLILFIVAVVVTLRIGVTAGVVGVAAGNS
jgi:hypothetical protein